MDNLDIESISSETVRKDRLALSKRRSAYDEDFGRRVGQMNKQIVNLESQVLERRKDVYECARRQERTKNAKKTSQMLRAFQKNYGILKEPDGKLRPSDQRFPVRITSRMDGDLWQSNELRGWFHKNAKPIPFVDVDPMVTSQYGVNRSPPATHQNTPVHYRDSGRRTTLGSAQKTYLRQTQSDSVLPQLHQSWKRNSSRENLSGAHWSNHEKNLHIQKHASASKLNSLHQTLSSPEYGHMIGVRPPWQENPAYLDKAHVPTSKLRERENFLLNGGGTENYQSDRDLTYMRKLQMEGGSGFM